MKKNGLVTQPAETPKRVILYPNQETTNQQTFHEISLNRPKTALISNPTNELNSTTNGNGNNNHRTVRGAPNSSPPSGQMRNIEKPKVDNGPGTGVVQSTTTNFKVQNPYYANPFFRPKVVANQSQMTNNGTGSMTTLTGPTQNLSTSINAMTNPPMKTLTSFKTANPVISSSTRVPPPDIPSNTAVNQDDSRNWAHSVAPTSIGRRPVNDERQSSTMISSTSNINSGTITDSFKQKGTSTTDIVISLMDPLRLQMNNTNSSSTNVLTRPILTKDDINLPTNGTNHENSSVQPTTNGSAANNNHQDWRKNLTVRYQQNTRNVATAKIFHSKQPTVAPNNNETIVPQPVKSERILGINSSQNERTFQASDTTPAISLLIRKSTDIIRASKQENNKNIERSTSLQVPPSPLSNVNISETTPSTVTARSAENPPEKNVKIKESNNNEPTAHVSLTVPSSLISAKPTVSVDQQKAIITRVMIRRDFVKSTDSKVLSSTIGENRSFIAPQSNNSNLVQNSNPHQNNSTIDPKNVSNFNSNSSRIHQNVQQQFPLSQKSLLPFTSIQTAQRENRTNEIPRIVNPAANRVDSPQPNGVTPAASHRANSLSAAPAETKKRKDEINNSKTKRRTISASSVSRNNSLDKDPFEVEDEEFEAELEEESARSSESDVEADNGVSLDPASLLSDKIRRVGNVEVRPGFIPSLFAHVPPTIRFCTENQRIEQLPLPLRKMMKWKMSSITPNIVKNTVIRSGFRLISGEEGNDWLGTWSRHMKPICFKAIREYQKVNHFPGSFQIGRKDRLWRNLSHMQAVHSRREFDFVPQTYVLPADLLLFKRVFEEMTDTKECKWIIKPPASARGQGIRVISKMEHVPKKRPVIVQKYISNPYLINGHKFDLRLYVYVTSHDPLRIYLFDDGLTRFASRKYSASVKSLNDRFMHLTNYSINRYNSEYRTNNDSGACTGHKWSLKALWTYLKKRDVDVADIIEKIKDLIVKTIISADAYVNVLTKANVRRKFCVHELFGFDVILDEACKPFIVEVNISPSLHSNSPLDISVKGSMISDLLNLSGFMIPDRRDLIGEGSARRKAKLPKSLIFDRRILPQTLSTDEKMKHQYFSQRYHDEQARRNILDILTPDDLRVLIETEDEFNRRGSFERIFPTHQTRKYLKYFETPRYYNLILNEWITKYHRMEERGIALLNSYCKKNLHIQHPASDPNHMWTQYQKLQGHISHRDNENNNGY